jgi:Fe-S cluster assembly protein SufD
MATKETFISHYKSFSSAAAKSTPAWLNNIRKNAIDRFSETGFPTPKDEQWRFTRIRPLLGHDFDLAGVVPLDPAAARRVDELCLDETRCLRLAFVNGRFAESLSDLDELPEGVRVGSLQKALQTDPERIHRYISKFADTETNPFVALNTAHLYDGAYVYIPKNVRIEKPIHFLYVTVCDGGAIVSHPRNLIIAEEHSRAAFVESYVGFESNTYFTNPVTEIVVKERAEIDHCKLQRESAGAYHMATLQIHAERNSRFKTDFLSFGGALVRNNVNANLAGEGVDCTVNGLYLGEEHQHIDNNTLIEHVQPNCTSHELYKGILNGKARAVFNGKIHVHQDAQKTDAKQSNRCILLSDDAQVNTNPQLEIYADDVKCTHGAAVGRINEEAVFYLRSRGIDDVSARRMLIHAFANEVIEGIKIDPVREHLTTDLFNWLSETKRT